MANIPIGFKYQFDQIKSLKQVLHNDIELWFKNDLIPLEQRIDVLLDTDLAGYMIPKGSLPSWFRKFRDLAQSEFNFDCHEYFDRHSFFTIHDIKSFGINFRENERMMDFLTDVIIPSGEFYFEMDW